MKKLGGYLENKRNKGFTLNVGKANQQTKNKKQNRLAINFGKSIEQRGHHNHNHANQSRLTDIER